MESVCLLHYLFSGVFIYLYIVLYILLIVLLRPLSLIVFNFTFFCVIVNYGAVCFFQCACCCFLLLCTCGLCSYTEYTYVSCMLLCILTVRYAVILNFQVFVGPRTGVWKSFRISNNNTLCPIVTPKEKIQNVKRKQSGIL